MATRPDNKTTLRLAVELLKRIPRRRKISAKELQEQLRDAGIDDAPRWLALAGGAPLLAVELGNSDERLLLDALLVEISRGERLDPLAAATVIDKVVKAEKRPVPLKRVVEWVQKWLLDLLLTSEGQPPRYFVADAAVLGRLAKCTDTARLLAFNRKTLQYRLECEQPLNSRLFLEAFFLNYAAAFSSH